MDSMEPVLLVFFGMLAVAILLLALYFLFRSGKVNARLSERLAISEAALARAENAVARLESAFARMEVSLSEEFLFIRV